MNSGMEGRGLRPRHNIQDFWRIGGLAALLVATGCAEWPRYNHLDDSDTDLVDGSTDPHDLFQMTWNTVAEAEDPAIYDIPTDGATQNGELPIDVGYDITGVLEKTGWYDAGVPRDIEADSCPGVVGHRVTGTQTGDYVGDVDFFVGDVQEAGQLCARVTTDAPNDGWDLLLFPLDADCNVPGPVVGDPPLGEDLGGAGPAGWSTEVEPGKYAILLSAFFPNDDAPTAIVNYDLQISLVHPTTVDGKAVCPVHDTAQAE